MAAQFQYLFEGDRPVDIRGKIVRPGDTYEDDAPVHHGEFRPTNKAAKDHAAAIAEADARLAEIHARISRGETKEDGSPYGPGDLAAAAVLTSGPLAVKTAAPDRPAKEA